MNFLDGGDVSGEMSAVAEFRRCEPVLPDACTSLEFVWISTLDCSSLSDEMD
jgi:hypothetical protein